MIAQIMRSPSASLTESIILGSSAAGLVFNPNLIKLKLSFILHSLSALNIFLVANDARLPRV